MVKFVGVASVIKILRAIGNFVYEEKRKVSSSLRHFCVLRVRLNHRKKLWISI